MENYIKYNIENLKSSNTSHHGFDFFRFEYFVEDIEHLKKNHRHEFYTFILITDGLGSHIIDFEEYQLKKNRVFFINYGQVHAWKEIDNIKGYVVLFSESFYNQIFTGNENIKSDVVLNKLDQCIDLSDNESNEWLAVLKHIESEFNTKQLFSDYIICLELKVLALKYFRSTNPIESIPEKSNRKLEMVNRYKELINQQYLEKKLPSQFISDLNITANYLNALCNEISGISAGGLIKKRVILEAKRLLSHTDQTVSQIAYFLGFEDKSHFGKYFKNEEGLTPDGFRKKFNQIT